MSTKTNKNLSWPGCLSTRAFNALSNHYFLEYRRHNPWLPREARLPHYIPSAEKVREDIVKRNIIPGGPCNYGLKSHEEVCQCLGIEVTRKSAWNFDPFTGKPLSQQVTPMPAEQKRPRVKALPPLSKQEREEEGKDFQDRINAFLDEAESIYEDD